MKKLIMFLVGLILLGAGAQTHATPFSNTVDFDIGGTFNGRTFQEIEQKTDPFDFSYTHNVVFDPAATEIISAVLTLSHIKNSNNNGEVWLLYGGTATSLGSLLGSDGPAWVDQDFVLPSSLYSLVSGGGWTLALDLQERTPGADKINIDKSVLSGEYAPISQENSAAVPEPGTVIMLGLGFAGLAVYGKRRKNDGTRG